MKLQGRSKGISVSHVIGFDSLSFKDYYLYQPTRILSINSGAGPTIYQIAFATAITEVPV